MQFCFQQDCTFYLASAVSANQGRRPLPELAKGAPFSHYRCPGNVSGMKTPQQLSHQAIEEFKAAYQEEFGQTLTDDQVQEIALRLLRFFGILNQSLPDKNSEHAEAK